MLVGGLYPKTHQIDGAEGIIKDSLKSEPYVSLQYSINCANTVDLTNGTISTTMLL